MVKRFFSFVLFISSIFISLSFSAMEDEIIVGNQFRKKSSPVYLECTSASFDALEQTSRREFAIKIMNDSGTANSSDTTVGRIGINNLAKPFLCIGIIDVDAPHRRRGYATWALQTILSMYSISTRPKVNFSYFGLSVFLKNTTAISLYRKVGFSVSQAPASMDDGPTWQWMTLPRQI